MKSKVIKSLFLTTIFMTSSIFVSAQGALYLEGANSKKPIDSGSIYLESINGVAEKPIDGLTVSNGSKNNVIDNSSNDNNNNNDDANDNNNDNDNNETTQSGIVTAAGGLNVRSGPSTSYGIIGALNYKDTVKIVESSDGWYKIKYKSGYGYVSSSYASTNGIIPPTNDNIVTPPTSINSIVIDPGHGGSDPGAIGPSGFKIKTKPNI